MKPKVSIFGSTGCVGRQIVDVIKKFYLKDLSIQTLSCNSDYKAIAKQAQELGVKNILIKDQISYTNLKSCIGPDNKINIINCSSVPSDIIANNDLVMIAESGIEALHILHESVTQGIKTATANKESIVCGGKIIKDYIKNIIPLDSEHYALFVLLSSIKKTEIKEIIITATGGAFFGQNKEDASVEKATSHPVWNMGKSLCLESATMMNKVFEVIEAHYLFDIPKEKIKILIHPQTLTHAMIRLSDGQLHTLVSSPDMRLGIDYALSTCCKTQKRFYNSLCLEDANMQFFAPKQQEFPTLEFLKTDQEITLAAANKVANGMFLSKKIKFCDIKHLIKKTLDSYQYDPQKIVSLKDVFWVYDCAAQRARILSV